MLAWYKKQSTLVKILLAIPLLIGLVLVGLLAIGRLASVGKRNNPDSDEISRDKTVVSEDSKRVRQDTERVKDIAGEISGNNQRIGELVAESAAENKRAASSNTELGSLADAIRKGLDEAAK